MKRSIALLVPALAIAIAACSAARIAERVDATGRIARPSPASTAAATPSAAPSASAAAMAKDIVQTATEAGSFSTLLTAVEAAGLVETLQGEGPYTVFAPTDEAFAALPAGTLDGLLADTGGAQEGPALPRRLGGRVIRSGRRAHLRRFGRGLADRHRRQGRNRSI